MSVIRTLGAVSLALLLLVSMTACRGPDWRIVSLYGGAGSAEILTAPQKAEAFRIESVPMREKDPDVRAIGNYRVTAGPVPLSAAQTTELSAILLDPDTYDWHRAKGCDFQPGVGLRLSRAVSRVDIALCFSCDELQIYRQGRAVGMEDFDAARPRLVALVKALFPDDAKIQSLE